MQPDSRRSQIAAGKVLWKIGQPAEALATYERAAVRWPGDPMFLLAMMELVLALLMNAITTPAAQSAQPRSRQCPCRCRSA